jgi:predicted Zn-dependent protease
MKWNLFLLFTSAVSISIFDVYTTNCSIEAQSGLLRALHHINSIKCSGIRFRYIADIPETAIFNEYTNVVYCNATLTSPVLGLINMRIIQPYDFKMYVDKSVNSIALMNIFMHEMGHAVGLEHVNDSTSVMFSSLNNSVLQVYTESEKNQIAQKYWSCPQISNGRIG